MRKVGHDIDLKDRNVHLNHDLSSANLKIEASRDQPSWQVVVTLNHVQNQS